MEIEFPIWGTDAVQVTQNEPADRVSANSVRAGDRYFIIGSAIEYINI